MAKKDSRMDIHIHVHTDPELGCRLDRIEEALNLLGVSEIMKKLNFDALLAEVTETKDVAQSAILLLQRVTDAIRANAANEAEITRIVGELDASNAALAAAITANTPADPEPPLA